MNLLKNFLWLFLFLIVSCRSEQKDRRLERQYIKSYQQLDKNCEEVVKRILEPLELEDTEYKIDKIYNLEIQLDTSIFENNLYNSGAFIGIIYQPDSFDLHILNLIPSAASVQFCESINNNTELVINKGQFFKNNLHELGINNCLGFDTTIYFEEIESNSVAVWSNIGSSLIYGNWIVNPNSKFKFQDNLYNNLWKFVREDKFLLLNEDLDTLIQSSFSISSDSLIIENLTDTFMIVTLNKSTFMISEFDLDKVIYLDRVVE